MCCADSGRACSGGGVNRVVCMVVSVFSVYNVLKSFRVALIYSKLYQHPRLHAPRLNIFWGLVCRGKAGA